MCIIKQVPVEYMEEHTIPICETLTCNKKSQYIFSLLETIKIYKCMDCAKKIISIKKTRDKRSKESKERQKWHTLLQIKHQQKNRDDLCTCRQHNSCLY